MKTLKFIIAVFCITAFAGMSRAQSNSASGSSSYRTAIGLRAGETSGLTFKQFISGNGAIEAIAGVWPYGFSATVLYERHAGSAVPGLNWYYGAGGHAIVQSGRIYYSYYSRRYDYYYTYGSNLGIGIDGIIGVEYKIRPIPFAVSLDLKPFVEVNTAGAAFIGFDPGLGIKLAF